MKKLSLAISLAFAAMGAQALTVSSSFTNALSNTEINQTGSLNLFNTNLGTLNSVSLTLNGALQGTITLTLGAAAQAQTVTGTAKTDLFFTSTLATLNALLTPGPNMNMTFTTGPQVLIPGATFASGTLNDAKSLVLNPAAAGFGAAGGGTFDLSCRSDSSLTISGGGGFSGGRETRQASCGAMVVYDYTATSQPVPEPASLALVGLALAAAGVASRRKA